MGCGCGNSSRGKTASLGLAVRGAVGLIKAASGLGAAPAEVVQMRRDICRGCERATRSDDLRFASHQGLTTWSRCTACQCFIAPKTSLMSECCPLGKWDATGSLQDGLTDADARISGFSV